MDSYNFHFERMSNVDLHPLSLPVSRLSPAKSNSSIVEQFAHHQHGKGDSAYSSFSGGSTAPDYPPSLLPDDLQPSSFSHYADLKYIKSICHPSQLHSNSKTVDQFYCSMEVISQNYRNNTLNQNGNDGFHTNNKAITKVGVPLRAPPQGGHPPIGPPPVPARQDSLIATKNLEKDKTNFQTQQQQPHNRLYQTAKLESSSTVINPGPVYSDWKTPSATEVPQQPSYHSTLPSYEQTKVPMKTSTLFTTDNKAPSEQQMTTNFHRRLPPQGTSQSEHLRLRPLSNGGESNVEDLAHFENPRKRAHSANDWLGSEPARLSASWNAGQTGVINSSIHHKGQFYFVTGVCKQSESRMRAHSASVSETVSECSHLSEINQPQERERCHSTMENLFIPRKEVIDERGPQNKDLIPRSLEQENHKPVPFSARSSRSFDTLEEIDTESHEIGRHTANNPIFYCGPEKNCSPCSILPTKDVSLFINNEPSNHPKREEQAQKGKRQPLTDVASDRINKETTPLLYHLTGANRKVLQSKKDAEFSVKEKEAVLNKTGLRDLLLKNERLPPGDTNKNDNSYNTLDDSFKKYYKEKLKHAQSKVLKETSFKRRDLQLSLQHCLRPKPELRLSGIHSFSSSQDSETSTGTLTPSVASEETEKGSIVGEIPEDLNEEIERENERPAKIAQPQVASRNGGRRRLTPEQKKMCYSEPGKLNLLGSAPIHSSCRSFSNENESMFAIQGEGQDYVQTGEQGLVAARRKMFEPRGRALSASSVSRTNLKHLQHKALVEYMERKKGQKMADPHQLLGPQLPVPPRQRHSLGEKPFDWGPRPLSASSEGKNLRKKLNRPHSAGRILDSSSSSIRYAQFLPPQSCSGQLAVQSNQLQWRERQGPSNGMSASVESLLNQPEPPTVFRNRSTSTPHAFQAPDYKDDPVNFTEACSLQKNLCTTVQSTPEAQQHIRVVAQRGKSMEELGTSKLTRLSTLSKSSEQLDQVRDIKNISFFVEDRKKYAGKEPDNNNLGQLQKPSLLNENSDPEPGDKEDAGPKATAERRTLSGSHSPTSFPPTRAKGQLVSPGSRSPVAESFKPPIEASSDLHSHRRHEAIEREVKSSLSTTMQIQHPCESRLSSREVQSFSETERQQSLEEPGKAATPPLSNYEVSLSCGVTTDPSLWILPPEDQPKKDVETPDSVFEEPFLSLPPAQTSEVSASDVDVSLKTAARKNLETQDEESRASQETVERKTPEGETSLERPDERPSWEELVEAAVKADQSLAPVFYPLANRKTALMLMEQLLSEDTLLMEEHYRKKQQQKDSCETVVAVEQPSPPPDNRTPPSRDPQSKDDFSGKKCMLVSYIEERLRSLEDTRGALQAEIQQNVSHGEALEVLVRERCLPLELERYNLFIGDLERVVNLLLCLSARLARVQNALTTVDQDTDVEEKQSLDSRHRLLCKQREDAKDLKDNLDRRESLVSTFLSRQLSDQQLRDYRRFVQTKASLLIRQKDLEEKQRLGEEQLDALSKTL
ncbi:protein Shroom1 isoform X2 [Nerophis lumbriciformis]|uniref:protein Shroom1 isoform X2 n=1 Tax=Nerophis lumbriciformis TaxID=546530 RepID=UPI002ADF57A2|nr:protein Shroom1 isoform X2 [Nerophis lumbriciformis]